VVHNTAMFDSYRIAVHSVDYLLHCLMTLLSTCHDMSLLEEFDLYMYLHAHTYIHSHPI